MKRLLIDLINTVIRFTEEGEVSKERERNHSR